MTKYEKFRTWVSEFMKSHGLDLLETFDACDGITWFFIGNRDVATITYCFFYDDSDGWASLSEMPSIMDLKKNDEFLAFAVRNTFELAECVNRVSMTHDYTYSNFTNKGWTWKRASDWDKSCKRITEKTFTDDTKQSWDVTFAPMVNISLEMKDIKGMDEESLEDLIIQTAINKILKNPKDYITFDNYESHKEYNEG